MLRKPKRLLLCLMPLVLSGCATVSTTPPAVNDYCQIAKPMRYNSKLDSPATVAAIQAHDSQWVCVCEGDCPKTPSAP